MDAVGIRKSKKGWQIVHRCRSCGIKKLNRVAEDTEQADDFDVIIQLSLEFSPP